MNAKTIPATPMTDYERSSYETTIGRFRVEVEGGRTGTITLWDAGTRVCGSDARVIDGAPLHELDVEVSSNYTYEALSVHASYSPDTVVLAATPVEREAVSAKVAVGDVVSLYGHRFEIPKRMTEYVSGVVLPKA